MHLQPPLGSSDVMMEHLSQSGLVDPENFTNDELVSLFGNKAREMILMDAVFGNGDRHSNNIAILRNANTGEYLGMSPLYDFDTALQATGISDILISDAVNVAADPAFNQRALTILNAVIPNTANDIFRKRANTIKDSLLSKLEIVEDNKDTNYF